MESGTIHNPYSEPERGKTVKNFLRELNDLGSHPAAAAFLPGALFLLLALNAIGLMGVMGFLSLSDSTDSDVLLTLIGPIIYLVVLVAMAFGQVIRVTHRRLRGHYLTIAIYAASEFCFGTVSGIFWWLYLSWALGPTPFIETAVTAWVLTCLVSFGNFTFYGNSWQDIVSHAQMRKELFVCCIRWLRSESSRQVERLGQSWIEETKWNDEAADMLHRLACHMLRRCLLDQLLQYREWPRARANVLECCHGASCLTLALTSCLLVSSLDVVEVEALATTVTLSIALLGALALATKPRETS